MAKNRNNYANFYSNTRYLMPLMIGIIVGFALSLLCTPFYDCENQISSIGSGFFLFSNSNNQKKIFLDKNQADSEQEHQKEIDDYEPRINLQGKPKSPQKPVQKLVRPRYVSTELNIRYKLFVSILSINVKHRLNANLASFLNLSISNLQQQQQNQQSKNSKITFFVNNPNMNEKLLHDSTPPGISVVNFNDNRDNLLPFHSFKYVTDNYIHNYDWFFFATDETFIRASKLLNMLNHISTSQDLYMGYSSDYRHSIYCSLSSGILFSNTLLKKILPEIEWCTKNAYSNDPTENIGRCILHSSNLACTKTANGLNSSFYLDENFNFDRDISRLSKLKEFNDSIAVYRVKDIQTMRKLQIYFDQVDIDEIITEINSLETNILEAVCETPEGCDSLIWPLAAPPFYKAINRHEIIRWDYFNMTHLFLGTDFDVVTELSEDYQQDINEIIEFSLKNLNKNTNEELILKQLLNGYKQFDPTRGSAYILDLVLKNKKDKLIHKRVNIMRPLGLVEIIPMPYVTESPKITLITAFTCNNQDNRDDINKFFTMYQKYVLDVKEQVERINLFVVYLTTFNIDKDHCTTHIKSIIQELIQKKYSSLMSTSTRIIETEIKIKNEHLMKSESYKQLIVIETLSKRLPNEALILYVSFCVELQPEFLNRVRLNTVSNSQVFFPIPFSAYAPNIVYPAKPFPSDIEINKNNGYFNKDSYQFVSFYNLDFILTRDSYLKQKNLSLNSSSFNLADKVDDLYDLFSTNTNLHLLRATDQSLKCRWSIDNLDCDALGKINYRGEMNRCLNQKINGMGTKSELAIHLMKNYDKIFDNKNN